MSTLVKNSFLLLCILLGGSSAAAGSSGAWMEVTPSMEIRRSQHTATLLADGRLLLAGGFEYNTEGVLVDSTSFCELYDPATGIRTLGAAMKRARAGHTATLLRNGKVLVTGGYTSVNPAVLAAAELYDPVNDRWEEAGFMEFARTSHTATLLQDGRVLVAGGLGATIITTAELYDPVTKKWSQAGELTVSRAFHTATLLKNGKVLLVGGMKYFPSGDPGATRIEVYLPKGEPVTFFANFLSSIEVFDPSAAGPKWTTLGSRLFHERAAHTATMLPNGKVRIVGGVDKGANGGTISLSIATMNPTNVLYLGSSELFDPDTGTISEPGNLKSSRAFHTATLLPGGDVMVAGGYRGVEPTNSVEVYEQASGKWSDAAELPVARTLHAATLLPGGRVFMTGGLGSGTKGILSAVLYEPVSVAWALKASMRHVRHRATATLLPHEGNEGILILGGKNSVENGLSLDVTELYSLQELLSAPVLGSMDEPRDSHTATLLPDGTLLVVGGSSNDGSILDSAVLYDHRTRTWTATSALSESRFSHTATLLPGGRVLVAGGTGASGSLRSAELYDPRTKSWSPSRMEQEHTGHTATLLPNGRVLIAGGSDAVSAHRFAEVYDPLRDQWKETQTKMVHAREFHTATLLPNGKVLVVGGRGDAPLKSAELFDPSSNSWMETASMASERSGHTATLLPSGIVLVTGGYGSDGKPVSSAEVYDSATGTWFPAGAMKNARAGHSAVLLPNGSLFVVGGVNEQGVLSSAELYSGPGVGLSGGPTITTVTSDDWQPGSILSLQGSPLWVRSEAGGGSTSSSAANFPVLTLRSLENGRWLPLPGTTTDGGTFTATLPGLFSGHYVLTVTSSGLTSGKVIRIQNSTPPDTFLNERPDERTRQTSASFSFSSSAKDLPSPEDAFECALDTSVFAPCPLEPFTSDTVSLKGLADGSHTFRVRARDIAGNVDDEPASYAWLVDRQAPDTTLLSAPPVSTGSTSASFSFSAEAEDRAYFECSLDGASFQRCSSPFSQDGLGAGDHTFEVLAVDTLGNKEASPAKHTWIVQRSHYQMSCSASGDSSWASWMGGLVLLGVLRRRYCSPAA